MMMFTLEQLLRYKWIPVFEDLDDGMSRLTVRGLPDLQVYGLREELENEWREALASHLKGYIAVGKAVPVPMQLIDMEPGEVTRVIFDEDLKAIVSQVAA